MTADTTYNGWANYATWRVNLEMIDGHSPRDLGIDGMEPYEAGKVLKDWAEEIIEMSSSEGLARDYAYAFLSEVNWYDIAEHLLADYADEEEAA